MVNSEAHPEIGIGALSSGTKLSASKDSNSMSTDFLKGEILTQLKVSKDELSIGRTNVARYEHNDQVYTGKENGTCNASYVSVSKQALKHRERTRIAFEGIVSQLTGPKVSLADKDLAKKTISKVFFK